MNALKDENKLLASIGKIFLNVQRFEMTLKGCLIFFYSIEEREDELRKILSNTNKDTLGTLISKLKKNYTLPQNFENKFNLLLEHRN